MPSQPPSLLQCVTTSMKCAEKNASTASVTLLRVKWIATLPAHNHFSYRNANEILTILTLFRDELNFCNIYYKYLTYYNALNTITTTNNIKLACGLLMLTRLHLLLMGVPGRGNAFLCMVQPISVLFGTHCT